MRGCNGCKHRLSKEYCECCVGWDKFEGVNPEFNPKVDIDRELKLLAKAGLNSFFGVQKPDMRIEKVIFNAPATVVIWKDGSKTIVKSGDYDVFDPEKGLAMAIAKKALGNQGNYYEVFKKWLPEDPVEKIKRELKEVEDCFKEANSAIEEIERFEKEDNLEWLTPEELAEKLGVTKATIQKQCREGLHPGAVKVGGKWKIPY